MQNFAKDRMLQNSSGSGDNVAGNKVVNIYYPNPSNPSRLKYLNTFALYEIATLVGRESQLEAIKSHLEKNNLLLLQGIGGIGKTTLARAIVIQNQESYDYIAYVEIIGSIAESMLNQLSDSSDVGLVINPNFDIETRFKALVEILRHLPRLLIVLDNANDADDLTKRKNQLSSLNAKVLITGRARPKIFVEERNIQDVDALSPDESLKLFQNHYTSTLSNEEASLVRRILSSAFHHPKLIEVIAKAAQENPFLTLGNIEAIVSKKHYNDEEINYSIEVDSQTRKIYRVLLDLFDTNSLTEDTRQLLLHISTLPTRDIPIQDLSTILLKIDPSERLHLLTNLNILVRAGWLQDVSNRFFSMHALVQWVVRQRLSPNAVSCKPLIIGALKTLSHEKKETLSVYKHYLPYTIEWLAIFSEDQDKDLASLFREIGIIYRLLGLYQDSLNHLNRALIIGQNLLGVEHNFTLSVINSIANVHLSDGNYPEALKCYNWTLSIYKSRLGDQHPTVANALCNIGNVYYKVGPFEIALQYHSDALKIYQLAFGNSNLDTANALINVGNDLSKLKEYNKSVKILKESLDTIKQIQGLQDKDTAIALDNLGLTYFHKSLHENRDQFQEAFEYCYQALEIRLVIFGEQHPSTARSYNNLGLILENQGHYEKALISYNKALDVRQSMLSKNHLDTATTLENMGITYNKLSLYRDAKKYISESLLICEIALGKNHSRTIQLQIFLDELNKHLQ